MHGLPGHLQALGREGVVTWSPHQDCPISHDLSKAPRPLLCALGSHGSNTSLALKEVVPEQEQMLRSRGNVGRKKVSTEQAVRSVLGLYLSWTLREAWVLPLSRGSSKGTGTMSSCLMTERQTDRQTEPREPCRRQAQEGWGPAVEREGLGYEGPAEGSPRHRG